MNDEPLVTIKRVKDRLDNEYLIVLDKHGEYYWIAADQSESSGPYESVEAAEHMLPRP